MDYFSKWIEAEAVATISADRVKFFLWKMIICRYGVPHTLVADNSTQFASTQVRQLCQEVGIKLVFTSVEHPQTNGQVEAANKVILRGLKHKLHLAETSWVDELPHVLWSYHTTPHSSTHETTFCLVYGTDVVLPIELAEPSFCVSHFSESDSTIAQRAQLDTVGDVRVSAHLREIATKQRAELKYNSRVVPRAFREGDLVLKKAQPSQVQNKLSAKCVGPYHVAKVVGKGAYRLQTLHGAAMPRTWNATSL